MLSLYDPLAKDMSPEANATKAIKLMSQTGTIVTSFDRLRNGKAVVPSDPSLGFAANFLYTLTGNKPDEVMERAFDIALTLHADPSSPIYNFKSFAYDGSKSALNAYSIHLAHELKDTPIKVNSAHPGWVKTEMGTEAAPMEIPDGAKTSVALALLGSEGPSGRFIHLGQELPW